MMTGFDYSRPQRASASLEKSAICGYPQYLAPASELVFFAASIIWCQLQTWRWSCPFCRREVNVLMLPWGNALHQPRSMARSSSTQSAFCQRRTKTLLTDSDTSPGVDQQHEHAACGTDTPALLSDHGDCRAAEERRLIRRTLAGDDTAFATIHRTHIDRVRAVVRSFGLQTADVDDLAQQVFLKAHQALPRFRGDASINTWLHRIAHNITLNHLAKGCVKREITTDNHDDHTPCSAAAPEQEIEWRDAYEQALIAAQTLPEHLRDVWALHFLSGLDYRSIARVVGCPIGTVRSRLFRARERIRANLGID